MEVVILTIARKCFLSPVKICDYIISCKFCHPQKDLDVVVQLLTLVPEQPSPRAEIALSQDYFLFCSHEKYFLSLQISVLYFYRLNNSRQWKCSPLSKQNMSYNCQKDFSHYTLRSIELIQDVIGKQIQQHTHQGRLKCLSWEWGVI